MKKKLIGLLTITVLLSTLTLTSCSSDSNKGILADGVLTVCVDVAANPHIDNFPMEFYGSGSDKRTDGGTIKTGFDIDFAKALAEELGVDVKFVEKTYARDFDKYDVIISNMSIASGQDKFNMSNPYFDNGLVVVANKKSVPITSLKELSSNDYVNVSDAAKESFAENLKDSIGADFSGKAWNDSIDEIALSLKSKEWDGSITTLSEAMYAVVQKPDDLVINGLVHSEPIGIASQLNDNATTELLNKAIETLQKNGKMKEITTKWFGQDLTYGMKTELPVIK